MKPTSPKATRREWIGLAVLALPCILATMDLTVLNLAAPHLSEQMKPSASQLLWILDIYGFMIAGSLITMGTLGDRIGRRKVLLIGAAAFGVASVLAAFSPNATMLILARALLGVAGATLAPSTLSLIRNMFLDERERMLAISIWVTCFSVGAAIGPVLGGIMLAHFWWGSVFLLNVPVMILLLILGPLLLPEYNDPKAGRLDILSAAMSLIAVLLVIFGLKRVAEHGIALLPLACMASGFVVGWHFLRRQKKLADPLIDPALFRSVTFTSALLMNMLGCFVAFGIFFFVAQYLQLVLNLTPLKAGLWSLPSSIGFMLGTTLTPRIARRLDPWFVIAGGLVIAAVGFGILMRLTPQEAFATMVMGTIVYSFGIAPIFTLATDLIVGSAPPERAGAAASLSETSTEFGGAMGMAVLGSIGMALYRIQVAGALPEGLSPDAAQAARSTLGGAIAAAHELPVERGLPFLTSAHAAFERALHFTCAVNIVVVLLLAGIAIGVRTISAPSRRNIRKHD
jgi:DHA2 family multidrug resistance protein-like MFS transporter